MHGSLVFQIANTLALVSWIYLLLFPFRPSTSKIIIGSTVMLLSLAYAILIFQSLAPTDFSKFSTLEGVTSMMALPGAALVGWLHYLAFDLMVGLFIAANGAKHGINRWALLPCVALTFVVGPVGLLLYLLVRWSSTRQYAADNF